jgi:hypothetical protein
VRVSTEKEWRVAENRSAFDYKQFRNVVKVLSEVRETDDPEALDNLVRLLKNGEGERESKMDYLVSCFPSVEKEIFKLYKKLDF